MRNVQLPVDGSYFICDGVAVTEGDRETLAIALDHAWRWYENRYARILSLMQILILWVAVLGTAYGVALQMKQYGLGGGIGLLAVAGLVGTEIEASRMRASAALAAEAIAELQDRLAQALDSDAIRLHQREIAGRLLPPRILGVDLGRCLLYLFSAIGLAGSFYTWLALP